MASKQFKIKVLKSHLDNISNGKCVSNLIQRDLRTTQRNICYITTAIHMFANSVEVLQYSMKSFQKARGAIILHEDNVECEYFSHL